MEVESSTVYGALLLTDIEAWTARVEQLRGLGSEGLDELARALNAYFAQIAETVYAHGGDVLTVAGDAFLCLWPAADATELGDATARATAAGLSFQSVSRALPSPGGTAIRTRIGVAAGDLHIALVGGVNGRWEVLPAGRTFDEVIAAEVAAPTHGVVLARSAWDLINDRVLAEPVRDTELMAVSALQRAPEPVVLDDEEPDIPAEVIAPFVPAPVRAWKVDSGTEWLAEVRHVTVVMARLLDREVDPAKAIERSQRAIRAFQETIVRFEGASKPGMDNKGLTLSAVFGLPPRAHEDDGERGLRAASALRTVLAELDLPCSVGVASGRAFCGLFGSDLRREYALYGDVTNLAARLAYAAHGEILCDDVTPRQVRERFRFEPLPPITVKGWASPVAIARFVGMQVGGPARHSDLVDREAERREIGRRLKRLTDTGEPGVVVIEGDAGIGKSALVAESARLAQGEGVRVLTAAADAIERTTAYYAWRPVFADALGLNGEAADPAELERRALQLIGGVPEVERLIPLLSSVLPARIPDNEWTQAMAGDVRADNTTMLFTRVLSRLTAVEPALLVVEDAHWLDSSSRAVLRRVVRSVPRLLTIVTTRSAPAANDEHSDVLALASDEPIRLTNLSPEHTAALVRQRLGVTAIPADLSRFVQARVAGHPFFCEALVKTMQEGGIVQVREGATTVGDLSQLDVPSTVEGAVLSLVDRLTPQQQLSLKLAAVVGPTFSLRTVSEAHPVGGAGPDVAQDLQALQTLDLVVPHESEGEQTYAFRHDIMRDVAYGLLTESQRRPLHRAVAEWYERSLSAQELEPHHALLAHHWSQAEDAPKAISYLERAARSALRGGAFREAAQFYAELRVQAQRDGSWAADLGRRVHCQQGEAAAYYFLGDFERSRALIEDTVARLDRTVPKRPARLAASLAVVAARQAAHLAAPSRYRNRRLAEKALLDEAVDCYKTLVQICYLNGESGASLFYYMLAGLNLGEEAGSSPQLARALVNAAGITSMLNLRRLADSYGARAVQMADLEGQSEALAYVWNVQALMEAQRGHWRRSIQASNRALQVFGEIGDYNLEAELWQTRSALHICSGDFRGAEACWRRTRELAARNANPQLETWSLLDEVETQVGRGAVEPARSALDAALAIDTPASDGGTLIEKHYATALTRLREERRDEALRAADAVVEMVTAQIPTGFHWADFAAGAVEVYLEMLEQASDAAERRMLELRAERGCKALRRISWNFHGIRPRRLLLQGRLEWEQGQPSRARRCWLSAERMALAMAMEYDTARARLELVRHGMAGAEMRAQVIEALQKLGADHWLRVAERA
ncbi:MAG TPA: AAA family ATPase [Solirubrobacteraceae bacterium]|nr:AAA family ATPase [Solirubrobacteraceae bacterium]